MMRFKSSLVKPQAVWVLGLLSAAALVGCSGVPTGTSSDEMAAQELDVAATAESAPAVPSSRDRGQSIPTSDVLTGSLQSSPQLIKHATLQLEVDDMAGAIAAISDTLAQYQGDLLQLSELNSQGRERHQMNVQLRVPQSQLDAALDSLRNLGTVESQAIAAEDVSSQLVDLQARVRNLRKSEAALLEIMERSGSIADVLEVSRELSTVREAIERHEAQLQSLQTRVAYSTIALTLTSPATLESPSAPVGATLGQTWYTASSSMKTLSVGLLQLSLWLLAFSPYIGLLGLVGWLGRCYWQRQRSPVPPTN